jgi:hypothetical protein
MSHQRQSIPALSQGYQQRTNTQDNSRIFFSQTNYARLLQPLREHYEKKLGKPELPENIDSKLQTRLQWYMDQVIKVNGATTPINTLNQDVYRETMLNMDSWFQKQTSLPNPSVQRNIISSTNNSANDKFFESVGSRFEKEQQSRAPPPSQPIVNADFSLPSDDSDSEDPLEKYERLRKERESESAQLTKSKNLSDQYSEPSAQPAVAMLLQQTTQNRVPPLLAPRPQEYIIKEEDVVKYRENEQNLFIYSGDRNWLLNRNENRYKFTINFNAVSNSNVNTFSPSVQSRFRNIVRIELVKMIVSGESLEIAPNKDTNSRITNVLTYPYLMIHLEEWSSNSHGTNNNIDNCFAVVHFDQSWRPTQTSGSGVSDVVGYISMTPRYLKAQRVYHPTPLATLQKLTFTVERPDGNQISTQLDTMDINSIYLDPSGSLNPGSAYQTSDKQWIFIKTTKYFSQFFAIQGDRIIIQGYQLTPSGNVTSSMATDLNNYINDPAGHLVVGFAYDATLSSQTKDGSNTAGYANYIIIRNRYKDPSEGDTAREYFGGSLQAESNIATQAKNYIPSTPCALLNINRQSHFVLRIITREMDSTSNLRPDNS